MCCLDLITTLMTDASRATVATTTLQTEPSIQQANTWPTNTNLLFLRGSIKYMLTLQHPLHWSVIKVAFGHIQAYLVFTNTFPDVNVALIFAHNSFIVGAEAH